MPNASYLNFADALQRAREQATPAREWLAPLLACADDDTAALYRAADAVRAAHVGSAVHLRGLIEFSNYCRKNCAYCGVRRGNSATDRYRLSPEAIIATALEAERLGYHSVVLQSGEDMWYTTERMCDIIGGIKAASDLAITLSCGERDTESYRAWREAGADRYLLRIETTDPALFAALHPDDDLEERKACLYALRELGYQLGSGVMVGLPGQTPEILADDVIWLHALGAEMIGVGPFIPHPATPLKDATGGTVEQTLRLVAVLRLVFPDAHLPATTAMGSLHPLGRERALEAGGNVMMPNVTPTELRTKYEIYPGKICLSDDAAHCRGCITGRIHAIGRTVGTDHGHVKRVADEHSAL
ncbi:MAG TPA: [FeFe] hydrogenase H-cluster radical SAM maturase HydE [Armatimonadota bacterium]|jgi:biotin synthase